MYHGLQCFLTPDYTGSPGRYFYVLIFSARKIKSDLGMEWEIGKLAINQTFQKVKWFKGLLETVNLTMLNGSKMSLKNIKLSETSQINKRPHII